MIHLLDGYTILTKKGCNWCTRAKELVPDAHVIPCDEFLEDRDRFFEHVDSLTGVKYRMFPMVFFDRQFVGGYTELKGRTLTFEEVNF